jgi:hypothetical protein
VREAHIVTTPFHFPRGNLALNPEVFHQVFFGDLTPYFSAFAAHDAPFIIVDHCAAADGARKLAFMKRHVFFLPTVLPFWKTQ